MSEPLYDIEEAIARASDVLHNSQEWKAEGVYAAYITPALDRLSTALTLATQRAEAAEAERDEVMRCCRGTRMDDAALVSIREYVAEKLRIEAERDALRKDAALIDALQSETDRFDPVVALVVKCRHDRNGSDWANITGDIRAALDAALAVQP